MAFVPNNHGVAIPRPLRQNTNYRGWIPMAFVPNNHGLQFLGRLRQNTNYEKGRPLRPSCQNIMGESYPAHVLLHGDNLINIEAFYYRHYDL